MLLIWNNRSFIYDIVYDIFFHIGIRFALLGAVIGVDSFSFRFEALKAVWKTQKLSGNEHGFSEKVLSFCVKMALF